MGKITQTVKIEMVKGLIRQVLKQNKLCCCAGDFQCANCRMLENLQVPREYACQNCMRVIA